MKNKLIEKLVVFGIVIAMFLGMSTQAFAAPTNLGLTTLSGFSNYHNVIDWGTLPNANITLFTVNGKVAFCTQAGRGIRDGNGNAWVPGNPTIVGDYIAQIVSADNSDQSKIAYLGYYSKTNPTNKDYAFTQMMIWQSLPSSYQTANGSANGSFNSYFNDATLRAEYTTWKNAITSKIQTWATVPSFDRSALASGLSLKAGESKTITDSRGVLQDYNAFSYTKNGVTVSHTAGSNSMTCSADSTAPTASFYMSRNELVTGGCQKYTSKAVANYVYSADRSQNLAIYGYADPLGLDLRFNVEGITGKIAIEKTKEDLDSEDDVAVEEGAEFQVYLKSAGSYENASVDCRDIITSDSDGKATTKALPHGTYTVHQTKGAEGHLLAKDFDVVITADTHNKTYTYKLTNDLVRGKVIGYKTGDKNEFLQGALFGLFKNEEEEFTKGTALMTAESNEEGTFTFSDVPYGEYIVREISAPLGYLLSDEKHVVAISEEGEVIELFAVNGAKVGYMRFLYRGAFEEEIVLAPEPVFTQVKTGDDFDIALWIGLTAMSVTILLMLKRTRTTKGDIENE